MDITLDGVDIFLLLLDGIGVIEAQMAATPKFPCNPEIETDGLGMADVQIAVRFRRKAGHHGAVTLRVEISPNDIADEVASRLPERAFTFCHAAIIPLAGAERPMCQIPAHAPRWRNTWQTRRPEQWRAQPLIPCPSSVLNGLRPLAKSPI